MLATILVTTSWTRRRGRRRWATARGARCSSATALVRRELERFRGTEIDTAGDGFLATFDGPARAIRYAVAVRDGVLALEVRAGLHGEVELAKDGVRGIAVHTAARVAGEAGPARSSSRARSRTSSPDPASRSEIAARRLKGVLRRRLFEVTVA